MHPALGGVVMKMESKWMQITHLALVLDDFLTAEEALLHY